MVCHLHDSMCLASLVVSCIIKYMLCNDASCVKLEVTLDTSVYSLSGCPHCGSSLITMPRKCAYNSECGDTCWIRSSYLQCIKVLGVGIPLWGTTLAFSLQGWLLRPSMDSHPLAWHCTPWNLGDGVGLVFASKVTVDPTSDEVVATWSFALRMSTHTSFLFWGGGVLVNFCLVCTFPLRRHI